MKKTFKDFWTHDMKQFYDDSWGQENYNHEKEQSSMPVEPDKWKICPADQYFNRNATKRLPYCSNCKERGHMQYECLKRQMLKCIICGLAGHFFFKCPSALCTTCRSAAKKHTSSCYNCRRIRFMKCDLCKALGHEMQHCPDLWRRYHLTTKYRNKMLKKSKKSSKEESELWCSNCAHQGHPANKCTYPRHQLILSTTEVFSYDDMYNNDSKLENSCVSHANNAPKKKKKKNKTNEGKAEKYRIILEKIQKNCNKSDSNSLALIRRYLNDIKNNKLSKKFKKKINKLRDKMKIS